MDCTTELKTCIKCEEIKPIQFFYQQKGFTGKKDGFTRNAYYKGKCKKCYAQDRKERGY